MDTEQMTIGELARRMGITVRTLQYYDREGILKPSSFSRGGHRLYDMKDMIKLHQILSFKYLGFSLEEIKTRILPLDTPEQMASLLLQQQKAIEEEIENLKVAFQAIEAFRNEVERINCVNFKKYAEIIELLRMGNDAYWVWKCFDDTLTDHIQQRFGQNSEEGDQVYQTYQRLLNHAVLLVRQGESPQSESAINWAEQWWGMIMDFTGGDLSLLPKLKAFNQDKTGWDAEMAEKQKTIDDFMEQSLYCYFERMGNVPSEMEVGL